MFSVLYKSQLQDCYCYVGNIVRVQGYYWVVEGDFFSAWGGFLLENNPGSKTESVCLWGKGF